MMLGRGRRRSKGDGCCQSTFYHADFLVVVDPKMHVVVGVHSPLAPTE